VLLPPHMRNLPHLAFVFFAILGAARGQTYEGSLFAGVARMSKAPLGSLSTDKPVDTDTSFRNGLTYGLRFTYNMRGYYGHEFGYAYTRATVRTRVYNSAGVAAPAEGRAVVHQTSYNFLIYFMPKDEWWRPYITGGLEAHRYGNPHIAGWTGIAGLNYGANYGGGIKFRLMKHLLVRLDVRDQLTGKPYSLTYGGQTTPTTMLHQMEASAGLSIGF
jgi:hypothetical protein